MVGCSGSGSGSGSGSAPARGLLCFRPPPCASRGLSTRCAALGRSSRWTADAASIGDQCVPCLLDSPSALRRSVVSHILPQAFGRALHHVLSCSGAPFGWDRHQSLVASLPGDAGLFLTLRLLYPRRFRPGGRLCTDHSERIRCPFLAVALLFGLLVWSGACAASGARIRRCASVADTCWRFGHTPSGALYGG